MLCVCIYDKTGQNLSFVYMFYMYSTLLTVDSIPHLVYGVLLQDESYDTSAVQGHHEDIVASFLNMYIPILYIFRMLKC